MRKLLAVAATICIAITGCDLLGPSHGPPAALTKTAGDDQQVVVGNLVSPSPAVRVTDSKDRPVPRTTVAFAVTSGGGTITEATATTNGDGVASVSSWTIGTSVGTNTLSATVGTLTPVVFTVTGIAGPAATIQKTAGDAAEGHLGTEVTPKPTVHVADAYGNPASGVSVTFALASGGGTVTGATQSTSATGDATVGAWTLGSTAGVNTLTATVGSLTPVTFAVTGVDMCARVPEHTVGTTVSGMLTTSDCLLATGFSVDKYGIARSGLTSFRLDQRSTAIDSRLVLFSLPTHRLQQSQDNSMNAVMYFIVGPGTFEVGASATATGVSGAYTLESSMLSESITNCVTVVLVNSPTTSQSVQSTDCDDITNTGTYYLDAFIFFAQSGRSYTVSMTTSAFDPYFEIQNLSGSPRNAASATGSGTRTATSNFTPSENEHRVILASTFSAGKTGSYTLSISSTAPALTAAGETSPALRSAAQSRASRPPRARFIRSAGPLREALRGFSSLAVDSVRSVNNAPRQR